MNNQKSKNTLSTVFLSLILALVAFCPFAHGISSSELNHFHLKKSPILPVFGYAKSAISSPTGEIWGRLRKQFNLPVSKNHPTFKYQLKRIAKSQDYVNELVTNASPYLYYILEEVEKRGMPSEIALLPMVESTFDPQARSSKGATGLWQLMPDTGRIYGLKQNTWYDGRKDIYESTKAALDHLEYLHKRFDGNWSLALAAYNSGEGKVSRAISHNKARKKPTDFWSLNLPQQTSNFVPKLLAIAAIIKTPEQYGVDLPTIPNRPVFTQINTGKPMDIAQAAEIAEVPVKQLQKLNPGLQKKTMAPNGPYKLVVPVKSANALHKKVGKEPALKTAHKTPIKVKATKHKTSRKHVAKKSKSIGKIVTKHKSSPAVKRKGKRLPHDVIVVAKSSKIPVK